jgi:methylated-DNA-[protein]-cysteine S-methyltransferase
MTSHDVPSTVLWEEADSPLGSFLIAGDGATVVQVNLPGRWAKEDLPAHWAHEPGSMAPATRQLDEYFAGTRRSFDLDFRPSGTPFQLSVWRALQDIAFATTATYRDVATAIGNPKATRAVGLANNRNPIALFIPCHRVIGADGSLTGYGGGLEMKSWLLAHERDVAASEVSPPQ